MALHGVSIWILHNLPSCAPKLVQYAPSDVAVDIFWRRVATCDINPEHDGVHNCVVIIYVRHAASSLLRGASSVSASSVDLNGALFWRPEAASNAGGNLKQNCVELPRGAYLRWSAHPVSTISRQFERNGSRRPFVDVQLCLSITENWGLALVSTSRQAQPVTN